MSSRSFRIYIALALGLALTGVWVNSRSSQKQETSSTESSTKEQGKSAATGTELKLKATRAGALSGESAGQQGARLLREAGDLLNSAQMKELRALDFKKPEDLERIRHLRHTPEFLLWRQLIRDTIACGAVDWGMTTKQLLESGMSEWGLQRETINLLSSLSVLESKEGDISCKSLLEAMKLNQILNKPDSWIQQLIGIACNGVVNSKVADHLGQASPEALDLMEESLKSASKQISSDCLQTFQGECQFIGESLADSDSVAQESEELQKFLKDPQNLKSLQDHWAKTSIQIKEDWDKAQDWQQRKEALDTAEKNWEHFSQLNADPAIAAEIKTFMAFSGGVLGKVLDSEARRQSTLAAIQIEQFRRANGRLPASLEEAGWTGYGEATGRAMNYEVKDGKAVISTAQEVGANKTNEIKW